MRKALIIGYLWPYRQNGSVRVLELAKYLPEFGWDPIILTAPLSRPISQFRVIETPNYPGDIFWFLRKIFTKFGLESKKSITEQIKEKTGVISPNSFIDWLLIKYQEIFAYPDTEKNWKKYALQAADNLIIKEHIDAVISIWPNTSHLVAKEISAKYKIPWLADFPDPWSENHHYPFGKIRKFFDRRLEIRTIRLAKAVTAAAPAYARKESDVLNRPVETILHGYDPELVNEPERRLTHKFTITYTGTVYAQKQDPLKLIRALGELISEEKINPEDIELRFYGAKHPWITAESKKCGAERIVSQKGFVPKEEALERQYESQLLLLLCWEDKKETGVYPLKTFEYLAARRPILATGGSQDEDIKKIITETNTGTSGINMEDIKEKILAYYQEYKKNGSISYHGLRKKIERYSYRATAYQFAKILNDIAE